MEVMSSEIKLIIGNKYHSIIDKFGINHYNQPFIVIREISKENFINSGLDITPYGYFILEQRNFFYEIAID